MPNVESGNPDKGSRSALPMINPDLPDPPRMVVVPDNRATPPLLIVTPDSPVIPTVCAPTMLTGPVVTAREYPFAVASSIRLTPA